MKSNNWKWRQGPGFLQVNLSSPQIDLLPLFTYIFANHLAICVQIRSRHSSIASIWNNTSNFAKLLDSIDHTPLINKSCSQRWIWSWDHYLVKKWNQFCALQVVFDLFGGDLQIGLKSHDLVLFSRLCNSDGRDIAEYPLSGHFHIWWRINKAANKVPLPRVHLNLCLLGCSVGTSNRITEPLMCAACIIQLREEAELVHEKQVCVTHVFDLFASNIMWRHVDDVVCNQNYRLVGLAHCVEETPFLWEYGIYSRRACLRTEGGEVWLWYLGHGYLEVYDMPSAEEHSLL